MSEVIQDPGLAERLRDAARRHDVPGAVLGVLAGNTTVLHATGVINQRTGVEATSDTLFQIGSITKLLTAVMTMQCIAEGRFQLDTPVHTLLPGFTLGNADAAMKITVRQLLCHASGIDGDFFEDTGRGDDKVERYVLAMRALPQVHAPGAGFSYCNAGFVLLGRILELQRGGTWDDALRMHLLRPLGMKRFSTLPEHGLRYRTAIGHVRVPGDTALRVTGTPFLAMSNGPAGATPFGPAEELLRFARFVLGGGELDGNRVLAAELLAQMWRHDENPVPQPGLAHAFGLGFMRWRHGERTVIGHDGATSGQFAFLRIVPDAGVAIALLTNGGEAHLLFRELYAHLLPALTGLTAPAVPAPLAEPAVQSLHWQQFCGRFGRMAAGAEVSVVDGTLWLEVRQRRIAGAPAERFRLRPLDGAGAFAAEMDGREARGSAVFLDGGAALHFAGRLYPREGKTG